MSGKVIRNGIFVVVDDLENPQIGEMVYFSETDTVGEIIGLCLNRAFVEIFKYMGQEQELPKVGDTVKINRWEDEE